MKMTIPQIKKILADKKSVRSNWDTLWQDIGDYIFPRKSDVLIKRTEGEDLQVHLYDNTGPHSLELFSGIMMSFLFSVEEQWFEHSSGDVELDQKEHIKKYLQHVTRVVHNVLANSNFYNEAHEMLMDLGSFGTNIFGIEEDNEEIVRFFSKFIAEGYIGENARGKVDEIYMEYDWTARQILGEYGEEKLHKDVQKCIKSNDETKKFKVVHCIYPVNRSGDGKTSKGHSFYSHHIMPDLDHELRLSGFETFPYAVPRFAKATGETYGRSPGMVALPEVRVLNKMVEITLIGAEKVIDPPLQAPDDGFINQINTFPASISYYRAGGNDRIEPIFNDARVDFGFDMISEKQSKIRDAFYINQMMLPNKTGNPQTATEIAQKVEQSTRFMGPFMARMQKEFLKVVVDRVTAISFKRGILKVQDIPQELRGKDFSVRYTSFIARAQRSGTLQSILRFFQGIEPLVNMDPMARHYIDSWGGVKTVAGIVGLPNELLRKEEDANKLIEAEQKAMAEKQKAEEDAQKMASMAQASKAMQG